jgi:hypothetical protein
VRRGRAASSAAAELDTTGDGNGSGRGDGGAIGAPSVNTGAGSRTVERRRGGG